ncbi:hypothetical protein ACFL27_00750 [candidate division CSSED10-310 bacterium]|uniref:Uncharacterized protein n=1 Tax=candidate division CSSED10-310 bacterium TaxID=2855610 RepID=A0ABV6YR85_UNCC1
MVRSSVFRRFFYAETVISEVKTPLKFHPLPRQRERAFYIVKLLHFSKRKTIDILTDEIIRLIRNGVKLNQKGRLNSLEKVDLIANKEKSYDLLCA